MLMAIENFKRLISDVNLSRPREELIILFEILRLSIHKTVELSGWMCLAISMTKFS